MNELLVGLTLATAVGCALAAGALFAFSSFVMQALRRLPAAEGIAAMQAINVTAVTPAFMTALFGSAIGCVALVVVGLADLGEPSSGWLVGGGAVYLAGTVLLTMGYHVPRNDALAALDPHAAGAAAHWERYWREWTTMNHLRVAAGAAAAAALAMALHVG